jgi:transcriptional regulator with XRE-family HTH domain
MKRQIDTTALYGALLAKKEEEGRSWREIARDLGISSAVFTRLHKGARPDGDTLLTLTSWLGVPSEQFVSGQAAERDDRRQTLAQIGTYLRADRTLTPASADAIEGLLRAAYDQLAERGDASAS